jgi:hypothetical protein
MGEINMDTAIKKVQDKITFVAQDSDMLHEYRMREMAVYDFNNGMRAAELRGEQRSMATVAINLKQAGFSAGEIANFIGWTADETAKILKENG